MFRITRLERMSDERGGEDRVFGLGNRISSTL